MDFMSSNTCQNLARSFAGESQARNRYTIYAAQARKESQEYLARIFETTADNERVHAEEFLEKLQKYGKQPIENIDISAGYPYSLGATMENLFQAARGEDGEALQIYPAFAAEARREGFSDVAVLWENIARIEALHRDSFMQAYNELQTQSLYKKEQPVVWRCMNCGYVTLANEPWSVCPVCSKDRGWVEGYVQQRKLPSA